MSKARALDYRTVTDVIIARDKKDIELPLALFLSFTGHIAILIFLSVFQGFGWIKSKSHETINLGGPGGPTVNMVEIAAPTPVTPNLPVIDIPEPPPPEEIKIEEPVIDIPDPGAEIEFKAPEPKTKPDVKKPTPKPVPTPAAKGAQAAKPSKGAITLGAGIGEGGFGGEGPPADPGLTFYAQRVTSLIGEVWRRPYVTAARGTVLESVIYFAISRDGRTSDISIESTSGIPNMDQSAVRAVMDAGRLPPLPPVFRGDELTVSFSFRYTAGE